MFHLLQGEFSFLLYHHLEPSFPVLDFCCCIAVHHNLATQNNTNFLAKDLTQVKHGGADTLLNVSQGKIKVSARLNFCLEPPEKICLGAYSGCWQNSILYSCRNESQYFFCWLSANGCSLLLRMLLGPCHMAPFH